LSELGPVVLGFPVCSCMFFLTRVHSL